MGQCCPTGGGKHARIRKALSGGEASGGNEVMEKVEDLLQEKRKTKQRAQAAVDAYQLTFTRVRSERDPATFKTAMANRTRLQRNLAIATQNLTTVEGTYGLLVETEMGDDNEDFARTMTAAHAYLQKKSNGNKLANHLSLIGAFKDSIEDFSEETNDVMGALDVLREEDANAIHTSMSGTEVASTTGLNPWDEFDAQEQNKSELAKETQNKSHLANDNNTLRNRSQQSQATQRGEFSNQIAVHLSGKSSQQMETRIDMAGYESSDCDETFNSSPTIEELEIAMSQAGSVLQTKHNTEKQRKVHENTAALHRNIITPPAGTNLVPKFESMKN
jgi:hypothetical protein